jgi:hypothetical protein
VQKGSILFVEDFPGQTGPCKKFVYLLGYGSPSSILVFTISSQERYSHQPHLNREMVKIPKGTFACLPKDSWIQCFHCAHELQLGSFSIHFRVHAHSPFFQLVRRVVLDSDLLNRMQISDYLDVMDNDKSRIV